MLLLCGWYAVGVGESSGGHAAEEKYWRCGTDAGAVLVAW
jgi:hypothetical protein